MNRESGAPVEFRPSASPCAAAEDACSVTPLETEARFLCLAREWERHVAEAIVCSVPGAPTACACLERGSS